MNRLERLVDGEFKPYLHEPRYQVGTRLVAGVPGSDPRVFRGLVECLRPPYFLLYVLHTPRGEGKPGRYQSPAVSSEEFSAFLDRFKVFLSSDGRYDLWAHSAADNATVVWDRHDQVFAYGPLDRYVAQLSGKGFVVGELACIGEHVHQYRSELDHYAQEILDTYNWSYSPLRPEDEQ